MAAAVSLFVIANGSLPVAASRNDGDGAYLTKRAAQAIGIVAFVTEQVSNATGVFEEGGRSLDVADVTRRQHQCIGTADDVGERMDLRGPAAPGPPDRLR